MELTGPTGPLVVRLSASAPDVASQPSGQAVSTEAAPPAAAPLPEEKIAAGRARVSEFKALYPSQGFNRLLQGNKLQGSK